MDKIFYVYVHYRNDTNTPFYVGKGHGDRFSSKYGRNVLWNRISSKHGFTPKIVAGGLSETCAFSLERIYIHEFKKAGHLMANVTDGGGGVRGYVHNNRMPVCCSNGREYKSLKEAAKDTGVHDGRISAICKGKRNSAKGLTFWYAQDDPKSYVNPRKAISIASCKKIHCSNGMSFNSILDASKWIFETKGIEKASPNISYACSGKIRSAYGFSWWYDGDEKKDYVSTSVRLSRVGLIPVVRSDGMEFESFTAAAKHMRSEGHLKADGWPISLCARGNQKQAYGYSWSLCALLVNNHIS